MSEIDPLFTPKSVALIGASADPLKYGYWTAKSLVGHGYPGDIYFVSKTKAERIFDRRPYSSISDIEAPVDLAVIGVSIKHVVDTLLQCAEKKVKAAIIVTTGFGEAGSEGKKIEQQILEIARKHHMRIMGPNCMGMYNADINLNTSIIDLSPGPISLVLQSGNLAIDISMNAKARGLGYSKWATIGNQRDLRFHDFVRYIQDDVHTKVLLLYIEGLFVDSVEDGRRFLSEAKAASQKIPIAGIKIGRSEAGKRAAASHTGSLAGSEQVFDAALRQCGIIRLDSPNELLDVAEAFSKCPAPAGNRIAILTDGGGHGVMATDAAERFGLKVPVLSEETQAELRKILKPHCPIKNPVDLAGTPESDLWVFDKCAKVLLDDRDIDGVVIVGLFGGYASLSEEFAALENEVADRLVLRASNSGKPVTMHSIYHSGAPAEAPACLKHIRTNGIPLYGSVESAMRGMGALFAYRQNKIRIAATLEEDPLPMPIERKMQVQAILEVAEAEGRKYLVEPEARDILAAYGFPMRPYRLVKNREEALAAWKAFNVPVAMKIVSPDILHKTDVGGVQLNLSGAETIGAAYEEIIANASRQDPPADIWGVLVTPMVRSGIEVILGVNSDKTFGPTVMFGLGGVFVEVLKDVAFRVAPIGPSEAGEMIEEIKGYPILNGARGSKPVDCKILKETLVRLSHLATEQPMIDEIDLNPVLVHEETLAIVDARMVLKRSCSDLTNFQSFPTILIAKG